MSTVCPVRIQFKGYQLLYPVSILSVEDVLQILSQWTNLNVHIVMQNFLKTSILMIHQKIGNKKILKLISNLCVRGVDFAPFYDFSMGFWKCSDSAVFFYFFLNFIIWEFFITSLNCIGGVMVSVLTSSAVYRGFAPGLCKLQKCCTRLAAANAKAYQFLAHGRWFSQSTPAYYTSKNGCHDLAEILLKMALNTNNHSKSTD